jgi:hypothetical protein
LLLSKPKGGIAQRIPPVMHPSWRSMLRYRVPTMLAGIFIVCQPSRTRRPH